MPPIPGTDPPPEPEGVAGGVRAALPGDARAVASVHVASWWAAYRGLLPDNYLAGLSVEGRERQWAGILTQPLPGHVYVVELGGRIVGFTHVGPSGDIATPRRPPPSSTPSTSTPTCGAAATGGS